jgi:hypothetical protein
MYSIDSISGAYLQQLVACSTVHTEGKVHTALFVEGLAEERSLLQSSEPTFDTLLKVKNVWSMCTYSLEIFLS